MCCRRAGPPALTHPPTRARARAARLTRSDRAEHRGVPSPAQSKESAVTPSPGPVGMSTSCPPAGTRYGRVCVSVCLCVCVCICVCVCACACSSASPSVRPFVCLPVRLSACPSVCLSVCPSACLSVCLSACPSVRLSACPSVRLSTAVFTLVWVRAGTSFRSSRAPLQCSFHRRSQMVIALLTTRGRTLLGH